MARAFSAPMVEKELGRLVEALSRLPAGGGVGKYLKLQVGIRLMVALEDTNCDKNKDPIPPLLAAIEDAQALLLEAITVLPHIDAKVTASGGRKDEEAGVGELFEAAWTTYSEGTFDQSVALVEERLRLSGFDGAFFKDRTCFDGGCGTGRLAVAMAKGGARQVVAADVGTESLAYLRNVVRR